MSKLDEYREVQRRAERVSAATPFESSARLKFSCHGFHAGRLVFHVSAGQQGAALLHDIQREVEAALNLMAPQIQQDAIDLLYQSAEIAKANARAEAQSLLAEDRIAAGAERRFPSRPYEVLVQRERWRKVTPGESALCPAIDWPFASTVHYGETLAWSARAGDERGTAGPFDSKEEAVQHAEEFWGCARQAIEVAEDGPPDVDEDAAEEELRARRL